jgi:hypothetical protein
MEGFAHTGGIEMIDQAHAEVMQRLLSTALMSRASPPHPDDVSI